MTPTAPSSTTRPASVRRLTPDDRDAFVALREEMLEAAPCAFGAYLPAQRKAREQIYAKWLHEWVLWGTENDEKLCGVTAFWQMDRPMMRHRGMIFSVYVQPAARKQGCGGALMDAALAWACGKVLLVHLDVLSSLREARALYASRGFQETGRVARALYHNDTFYDEIQMTRVLA